LEYQSVGLSADGLMSSFNTPGLQHSNTPRSLPGPVQQAKDDQFDNRTNII